jgi:hypothetical protein
MTLIELIDADKPKTFATQRESRNQSLPLICADVRRLVDPGTEN